MKNQTITTLMHMENMVLGIAFGTAVSVLKNEHIAGYKGTYNHIKLEDIEDGEPKDFPVKGNRFAQVSSDNFEKIPGAPVAYWVSENYSALFKNRTIGSIVLKVCKGGYTGNNEKYLRLWQEVDKNDILLDKWALYSKGGNYRRWYGNTEHVIYWKDNGYELKHNEKSGFGMATYYGKEHLVWSGISSSLPSFRYDNKGIKFDDVSPAVVFSGKFNWQLLGYLNSNVVTDMLKIIAPTIHFQAGDISVLPIVTEIENVREEPIKKCIDISREDWDSFETSWDFKKHPLI